MNVFQLMPSSEVNVLNNSPRNVIYGSVHPKSSNMINFKVLLVKFLIFRCKCDGTIPAMGLISQEIRVIHDVVEFIAIKNSKVRKHTKR